MFWASSMIFKFFIGKRSLQIIFLEILIYKTSFLLVYSLYKFSVYTLWLLPSHSMGTLRWLWYTQTSLKVVDRKQWQVYLQRSTIYSCIFIWSYVIQKTSILKHIYGNRLKSLLWNVKKKHHIIEVSQWDLRRDTFNPYR